jgi:hypothetical protein
MVIGVSRDDYEALFQCGADCISHIEAAIPEVYNGVSRQCADIAQRLMLNATHDDGRNLNAAQRALADGVAYVETHWTVVLQCSGKCPDDGYLFGSVFDDEQRRTLEEMEELSRILRPKDMVGKQIGSESPLDPDQTPSISNVPSESPTEIQEPSTVREKMHWVSLLLVRKLHCCL